MHLLRGNLSQDQTEGEAVDLGQTPGQILIVSAADTELTALAGAYDRLAAQGPMPTMRLANMMQLIHPYSVDLYAELMWSKAQTIVLRVLGGKGYWGYGVEQAAMVAKQTGARLIVLPGDAKPDLDLSAESNVDADEQALVWDYFNQGGPQNLANLLAHLSGQEAAPPAPLIEAGLYRVPEPEAVGPRVGLVFYRAHYQSGNLAPIDAMIEACTAQGLVPVPLFAASLKDPMAASLVEKLLVDHQCQAVLNTTAFAISAPGSQATTPFDALDAPVFQVVLSSSTREAWHANPQGMGARDIAMHVSLPEVDGRILTRAVSFKGQGQYHEPTQCHLTAYEADANRASWVAQLAANWIKLRKTSNPDKRVALILANYPNKDGRLANGVGLDTPASAATIIQALQDAGYVTDAPTDGKILIETLAAGATNAPRTPSAIGERFSLADYRRGLATLPQTLQDALHQRWGAPEGDPFVNGADFVVPFQRWGQICVGIQPARGYNIDPETTYHDPDLIPPHGYVATYMWLRQSFGAQALIHVGKHGNLEWLPGKALALSDTCWPRRIHLPSALM